MCVYLNLFGCGHTALEEEGSRVRGEEGGGRGMEEGRT